MLEMKVKGLQGVETSIPDYVQDAGEEIIGLMNTAPRLMLMIIQCPLGRKTSGRASPSPTRQKGPILNPTTAFPASSVNLLDATPGARAGPKQ